MVAAAFLAGSAAGAEAPGAAESLKSAGANVSAIKEGGWAVDMGKAPVNEQTLKLVESIADLKRFSGGGEAFGDAELARLCKIPSLERIFLNGPSVSDQGLAALATGAKLHHFGVHHSIKITGSGLTALKDDKNLTSLEFGGCIAFGDKGVEALAELTQLRELRVGHCRNTRATFPAIAKLSNLEVLGITPNFDPHAYMAADFSALSGLNNLRELAINDMVLPYENGLEHLKAFKGLKELKIQWCSVKEDDLAKLKSEMPGLKVSVEHPAAEERVKQYEAAVEKMKKG